MIISYDASACIDACGCNLFCGKHMFTWAKFHSHNLVASQVTSIRMAQHTANEYIHKQKTRRTQVSKTILTSGTLA